MTQKFTDMELRLQAALTRELNNMETRLQATNRELHQKVDDVERKVNDVERKVNVIDRKVDEIDRKLKKVSDLATASYIMGVRVRDHAALKMLWLKMLYSARTRRSTTWMGSKKCRSPMGHSRGTTKLTAPTARSVHSTCSGAHKYVIV